MRRYFVAIVSALALLMGTMLVASPAQAAAKKPVTINKIEFHWVGWAGTAKHTPSVKKNKKKVSVKSKTITVYSYSAKKTIAKNKKSVNLKPGRYKITAKVKYKYKGKTKTTTRTYYTTAKQGKCAVRSDANKLKEDSGFEELQFDGDTIEQVRKKLRNNGYLFVSATVREILEDIVDDPYSSPDEVTEAQGLLDTLTPEELDSDAMQWRSFLACGYKSGEGIEAIFALDGSDSTLILYFTPDDMW